MAAENSFDIVSEVDLMEVANAVQQAVKEIKSRFDFKGSAADIEAQGKDRIVLAGDDEYKLKSVREVLDQKLVRRGVSLKAIDAGPVEPAAKGTVRQTLTVHSGLETELAKDIAKFVRGLPVRVQTTIQADQVRITGKKKDDLQAVITALKSHEWPRALQFRNYR